VSLTLFPITALLLLLSGMGSPMHAAGYVETVAALRKQFLDQSNLSPARLQAASHVFARQLRSALTGVHPNRVPHLRDSFTVAKVGLRNRNRKQYRTRFGFAEGAYLAVGPPMSAVAADLG